MRAIALIATLCLLPVATAAPPVLEIWEGTATSHTYYAGAQTLCRDTGPAKLIVEREMESATFTVVLAAACVPSLAWRGVLSEHGWRFEDALDITQGGFDPTTGQLDGRHSSCPPGFICEFPHGVRIHGDFTRAS